MPRKLHKDTGGDKTPLGPIAPKPKSWRDEFPPLHPAAELFPLMTPDELRELGEDIKTRGLLTPIILYRERRGRDYEYWILDGNNRLSAMEAAGIECELDIVNGKVRFDADCAIRQYPTIVQDIDPFEYVISANIRRRHLTSKQVRELLAKLIKAKPELSDRQLGKMAHTSKNTAASVRTEMERRGQIDHVETRVDTKGRKQPRTKPKRTGGVRTAGALPGPEPKMAHDTRREPEVVVTGDGAIVSVEQPTQAAGEIVPVPIENGSERRAVVLLVELAALSLKAESETVARDLRVTLSSQHRNILLTFLGDLYSALDAAGPDQVY